MKKYLLPTLTISVLLLGLLVGNAVSNKANFETALSVVLNIVQDFINIHLCIFHDSFLMEMTVIARKITPIVYRNAYPIDHCLLC